MPPLLKTSPSQYQVFYKFCPRKWWFRYVCKLEEPKKTFQGLGSAFHRVIETFLKADATGRDPATGKPVELYPPGLAAEFNLLPQDMALIQKLIPEAIENGTLYRPGGDFAVEREYFWDIPGGKAQEHGYTDLLEADCVSDHKTTSASRWALTREDLKFDLQMRAYALELTRIHRAQGKEPPEEIRLRHNIYITKDNPRAFFRETSVFQDDLKEHEQKILQIVNGMLTLTSVRATDWESIPDSPRPHTDACNAYGGCPYRGICAKVERPDQYKLRIENAKKTPAQLAEEGRSVRRLSLGNLLGTSDAKPAPAVPFTQAAAVVPPTPAPAAPAAPAAPWFDLDSGCKVCESKPYPGFEAEGKPCYLCEAKARPLGRRTSSSYKITWTNGVPLIEDLAPQAPPAPPAPWFVEGCIACSTNAFPGFTSKLTPCRVCDNKTAQAGGRPSSDFQITITDGAPVVVDVHGSREETTIDIAAAGPVPDEVRDALAQTIEAMPEIGAPVDPQPAGAAAGAAAAAPSVTEEPHVPVMQRRRGRKPGSKNRPKGEMTVLSQTLGEPKVEPFLDEDSRDDDQQEELLRTICDRLECLTKAVADLAARPMPQAAAVATANAPASAVGLSLAFGCRPAVGSSIELHPWLHKLKEEIETYKGVKSFYHINAFERRDLLSALALKAASELPAGMWIICPRDSDPDTTPVVNALRGLAVQVVE